MTMDPRIRDCKKVNTRPRRWISPYAPVHDIQACPLRCCTSLTTVAREYGAQKASNMNTHTPVYPVTDLRADDDSDKGANTNANVNQAADAGLEAVGL